MPSSRLSAARLLPVSRAEDLLLEMVTKHATVVIVGETGSGKSTQVPHLLMQSTKLGGYVAVTQPRRVAAVSLAQRVAWERDSAVGEVIGYNVRFDDRTSRRTRLRYTTDGMLLREAMIDKALHKYTVVVLDEAHERSLGTDVLFGVLKQAQRQRRHAKRPLRVVVMSATLDVEAFLDFFAPDDAMKTKAIEAVTPSTVGAGAGAGAGAGSDADAKAKAKAKASAKAKVKANAKAFDQPVAVYVEGRMHKVEVQYAAESQLDYMDAAVVTTLQIHQEEGPGDILCFLTGQEEIESCREMIEDKARRLPANAAKLVVCPLFAALPAHEQQGVFAPAPAGARKVVLATNIAETSITIPGVRFVVDTGMVKAKAYAAQSNLEMLRVVPVSKEQAWQRAGRAGREGPGKCFRLYKEPDFLKLSERSVPEILRVELSQVVLQLLALGVADVSRFDFMQAPSAEALQQALFALAALGAVKVDKSNEVAPVGLTPLGRRMAGLPLDPMHAKFLLDAGKLGCEEEALSVAAMMSVESPFFTPRSSKARANEAHRRFRSFDADHLTLLRVYAAFEDARADKAWCLAHFVKFGTMFKARKVRTQLRTMLLHPDPNANGGSSATGKARGRKQRGWKGKAAGAGTGAGAGAGTGAGAGADAGAEAASAPVPVSSPEPRQLSSCGSDTDPVLKCLVSAFSLRVAQKMPRDGSAPGVRYKAVLQGLEARIHPSSSLSNRDPMAEWVVFNELVLTSKRYLKCVAAIDQAWLAELAPSLFSNRPAPKRRAQAQAKPAGDAAAIKRRNLLMVD